MDEARDIAAVSIPFAAGVATAAALAAPGATAPAALAAVTVLFAACAIWRRCPRLVIPLLFFCLGIFCLSTSDLLTPERAERAAGASAALNRLAALIDSIPFPNRETGSLVKALLTGQRAELGREAVAAFRKAGAAHILALSGLHLGIIYGIIGKALTFLGNSRPATVARSVTVTAACGFYAFMTGFSPSITRAFLFILLNEMSKHLPGRRRSLLAIFFTALTLQLAFSPGVIRDVGFQLSYLAMLGIALLYPVLDGWYPSSGKRAADSMDPMRRIWRSMALAISCQAFTAPVVWRHFHTFPKYFLLTNLLAVPLAEALILCALSCLALQATAASCPQWAAVATDAVAGALRFCLETISVL